MKQKQIFIDSNALTGNWISRTFKKFLLRLLGKNKPAVKLELSKPYIFTVQNTGDTSEEVKLFGSDMNRFKENFGASAAIKFHNNMMYSFGGEDGYRVLLANTERCPFICGKIRVGSQNLPQLTQSISWEKYEPDGCSESKPVIFFQKLDQYFPHAVEQDTDLLISGGTILTYTMLAKTTATFFFWPVEKASLDYALLSKAAIKLFLAPFTSLGREDYGQPKMASSKKWTKVLNYIRDFLWKPKVITEYIIDTARSSKPKADAENKPQDPASEPNEGNANEACTPL